MTNKKSKKTEQSKSHIPFRLNLLFFIIFLLFVMLIVRSGYLQIIKGEEFQAEVERTESTVIRGNVSRGEIFDSELRPLVKNESKNTILYTRGSNTKVESIAEVAYNLANLIDMPHTTPFEKERSDLSLRDLRDYFYAQNSEMMKERVEEHIEDNNIEADKFVYSEQINLITEEELKHFSERDLIAAAIFTKMNSAYNLSTVTVKNDNVSEEEKAKVSEHAMLLPGVTTATDWDRIYPEGSTLNSVLGNVSQEKQGVPQDRESEYLAKGYSRNDRVGRSQLETQYEDVLRGSKSLSKIETDNQGDVLSQAAIYPGTKGDNLVLTIDLAFQEKVDQIVLEALQNRRGLNNRVYAVAMNPKNGDVLAMSGKRIDKNGKVVDATLDTIQSAFSMGSSVKAATVLMGYMDGVISLDNNSMIDRRMVFRGENTISSVFNRHGSVQVNDITALKFSSNVYMSQIALRMGGYYNYQPNQSVPINPQKTVEKMRLYYEQFGLGSPTGIDLPNEAIGQGTTANEPGKAMFLSFGQFDTYTPMQLAQYSATIANGGTRFAPRLVSEIRSADPDTGEIGNLVQDIEPKIMNTINVSKEEMSRVQRGLYEVVNGGYGAPYRVFSGTPYVAAGKTGTAEAFYWDDDNKSRNNESVTNTTFIGYAPYEDPEIAIAVVIPYLPNSGTGTTNTEMSRQIFDAYFRVGRFAEKEKTEDTEVDMLDSTDDADLEE